MFREEYPLTWEYHRNTCRWTHNIPDLPDEKNQNSFYKEYSGKKLISLPGDDYPDAAIGNLIRQRHSCRSFAKYSLKLSELSVILNSGYGVNAISFFENMEFFERSVPSGGGLYPLELYVITMDVEELRQGIYHYFIYPAGLEEIRTLEINPLYISDLFMNQPYVASASAIVICTSVLRRNMMKYGDRGYRYILIEAGHCFQNMNLVAEGLDLGTLNLGGFFDTEIAALLDIDIEEEVPLYAIAIGKKQKKDKAGSRIPG